jgi:hypothetical protein
MRINHGILGTLKISWLRYIYICMQNWNMVKSIKTTNIHLLCSFLFYATDPSGHCSTAKISASQAS